MAETRLVDMVKPERFDTYMQEAETRTSAFWNSGIVKRDKRIATLLARGGDTFTVPFFVPLDKSGWKESTDDPSQKITPIKATAKPMKGVRQNLNLAFAAMRITETLTAEDAMAYMLGQVSETANLMYQDRVIAVIKGITAANLANNSGDQIVDISTLTGDAGMINSDAITLAKQSMGDRKRRLKCIAMHSAVQSRLQKMQNNQYVVAPKDAEVNFDTYQGLKVVVDDDLPVVGGKYYTYLFEEGAMGFASGNAKKPFTQDSDEFAGQGSGAEYSFVRRDFCLHPVGYTWKGTISGMFPTIADLEKAANWERSFTQRKSIPFTTLITTG